MTKIYQPCELAPGLHFVGNPGVLTYLLTDQQSIQIDCGMTAMGPLLKKQLAEHLGDVSELDWLILTHSHYDHVGSVGMFLKHQEKLRIGAHPVLAEIVQRPNAADLIRKLNETVTGGPPPQDQPDMVAFSSFQVTDPFQDGQVISTGDYEIEVLFTPGHTRDSITYYLPHAKAIIPGEAAGVPDLQDVIMPEFLQSYDSYLGSLEKLSKLDLEFICLPHNYVLAGDAAGAYVSDSITASIAFKDRILAELNRQNGELEQTFLVLFDDMYSPAHGQPRDAFSINLKAMIKTVAREFD